MKKAVMLLVIILLASTICSAQRSNNFSLWSLGWAVNSISGISEGTQVSLGSCGGGGSNISMSQFVSGTPTYTQSLAFSAGGGYAYTEMDFPNCGSKFLTYIQAVDKNFSHNIYSCLSWGSSSYAYQHNIYFEGISECGGVGASSIGILFKDMYNSSSWYEVFVPATYN